jgi:hypothetical protein
MNVQNAAGSEHRLTPIAHRAASIFAARLRQRAKASGSGALTTSVIDDVTAAPVHCDLRAMSNEQAANAIASTWLNAVAQRLKLSI